ncbi:hypothetical protein FGO68_gene2149 [Halteria grandinella]|uniref:Uncharacterized protein n=1 Tax=Halteria grandinella TaxID=5974 RepID=A0A8J8NLD9_HALGN|nr:hypothetical protein FGO68_gene2149 [Halteria grandinella]
MAQRQFPLGLTFPTTSQQQIDSNRHYQGQFSPLCRSPFSSNFTRILDGFASLFDDVHRSSDHADLFETEVIMQQDQVNVQQVPPLDSNPNDIFELPFFQEVSNPLTKPVQLSQIIEKSPMGDLSDANFNISSNFSATAQSTITAQIEESKFDQLDLYQTNRIIKYQRSRKQNKQSKKQAVDWQILLEMEFNAKDKAFNKDFGPAKTLKQSVFRSFKVCMTGLKYDFTSKLHSSIRRVVGDDQKYQHLVSSLRSTTCVYKAFRTEDQKLSSIINATNHQKACYKSNKKTFFTNLLDDTYRQAFMLALPYIARITYGSDHQRDRKDENYVSQALYSKKVMEILEIVRLVDRRIKEHRP